jgi:hypothetical protein
LYDYAAYDVTNSIVCLFIQYYMSMLYAEHNIIVVITLNVFGDLNKTVPSCQMYTLVSSTNKTVTSCQMYTLVPSTNKTIVQPYPYGVGSRPAL